MLRYPRTSSINPQRPRLSNRVSPGLWTPAWSDLSFVHAQITETPTPLRSRDNPVRSSGGSPYRTGHSSPLWGRKSLRASQGSPLRTLQRRDKVQERGVGSHVLEGRYGPLRDEQELRGSGGSSPERTRDLPRRCKSGPLQASPFFIRLFPHFCSFHY